MNSQVSGDVVDAEQQRVQQALLGHLREAHRSQPGTWQATLNVDLRAGVVWNIYNAVRLAKPDVHDRDALQVAFANENERFVKEQNRDGYVTSVKSFLGPLQDVHRQNMQAVPNLMNPDKNAASVQEGVVRQVPTQPYGSKQDQSAS